MVYNLFMKSFNLKLDIKRLLAITDQSVQEFAYSTNLSRQSIINFMKDDEDVSLETLEKIYSYAYNRGIKLNRSKELIFIDEGKTLFHGVRDKIIGDIDAKDSNPPNDFGNGFYTDETLNQTASWIANNRLGSVYCFRVKDEKVIRILKEIK